MIIKKSMLLIITFLLNVASLIGAQAVVFDFGGVMTGTPNREIVVCFIRESLHLSESEFEKANQEKRLAIQQGKTDEEYWLSYAKERHINLPADWCVSLRSVMKEAIGVNPKMYALVDQLKRKQIPVALLSNIDERLSKMIRGFDLYRPFNPCVLSYEIGVEKPDPRAYQFILSKLNLPPKEVVFIDDKSENIDAAKKLGFDAILFVSVEQIRKELQQRGILE